MISPRRPGSQGSAVPRLQRLPCGWSHLLLYLSWHAVALQLTRLLDLSCNLPNIFPQTFGLSTFVHLPCCVLFLGPLDYSFGRSAISRGCSTSFPTLFLSQFAFWLLSLLALFAPGLELRRDHLQLVQASLCTSTIDRLRVRRQNEMTHRLGLLGILRLLIVHVPSITDLIDDAINRNGIYYYLLNCI